MAQVLAALQILVAALAVSQEITGCSPGNNGTPSTEDSDPGGEPVEAVPFSHEITASGSCFPSGEDESSGSEEPGG